MKHLLNGVAVVAGLVIAAPVWAQNPATPGATGAGVPPPTPAAPAPTSATPPMHHVMHHARAMHAHHMGMARQAREAGDTTAALNREELARIQSGSPSMPPPGGAMPGGAPGSAQPMPPPAPAPAPAPKPPQ
jgi:hypothetical protein